MFVSLAMMCLVLQIDLVFSNFPYSIILNIIQNLILWKKPIHL